MLATWMLEGLTVNKIWKAYNGFTLYTCLGGKQVKLINMNGDLIHKWDMDYVPALYGELLPNGNVLYAGHMENGPLANLEGAGGIIVENDWEGKKIWEYKAPYLHHAFKRLENGNTLVIKWDEIPKDICAKIKGGIEGSEPDGKMFGDIVQEITPDGKVTWEWISWEHLNTEEDIINPLLPREEWSCANSLDVDTDGNIYISFKRISTIAKINKSTKALDWKWGPHEISQQNGVNLTEEGNILFFDNGLMAEGVHHAFSRVIEIDKDTKKICWDYRDKSNDNCWCYSCFMSGCQRLPNGNTLVTESRCGRIFEITREGEIVWEYVNPDYNTFQEYGTSNAVPRAFRYGIGYPGLKGMKELNLGKYIQTELDVKRNRAAQRKNQGEEKQEEKQSGQDAVFSRLENLGY